MNHHGPSPGSPQRRPVPPQQAHAFGVLAVVAAAILWGSTGTVQTLLPAMREPLAVGALRLAFGALSLLALALAQPASRRALPRVLWPPILFAGVAIGAYNLVFFWAVSAAGVGIGTAVAIGSAPLWTTAYEALVCRRLPPRLKAVGQGLAILGVGALSFATADAEGSVLGLLLALAAGASYAAYSLATSACAGRAPSPALAAATFTVAALVTAPVLALVPLTWISGWQAWAALVFLGVGATGLSYALYTWGLGRVAASTAVTLALAEPVTAWVLASAWVGEALSATAVAGVALILGGLVFVALGRPQREE